MGKKLGIGDEKWILYTQLAFTAIAFLFMVALSYMFMSSIIRENLRRNVTSILSYTESHIEVELTDARNSLKGYSERLIEMIGEGADADGVRHYVDDISGFIHMSGVRTLSYNTLYGYFDLPEDGLIFYGMVNVLPKDTVLTAMDWYRAAVEADGEIVETQPSPLNDSDEIEFTYSVELIDGDGNSYGVLCLDVNINALCNDVVNTSLARGGYGMLFNRDFLFFAHANPEFVGRHVYEQGMPLAPLYNEFQRGGDISERNMLSFRNEKSIGYFRELDNGWTLGLVTPESQYYSGLNRMVWILTALGFALALVLILILITTDKARVKSVNESKQKSIFLANMSHEIRTPINAIVGMTSIGKNTAEAEKKDYCFTKIDNASQHLLGVINDILDMSKIEANKFELMPVTFAFKEMLGKVENIISYRAEEKRQTLTIHSDGDIPKKLVGDDQRIIQVIINLLSNAVKFTPECGNVGLEARLVSVTGEECEIQMEITDTGIGIAAENLSKIFLSFEQEDTSTTRRFGGTGLGLGISKRIVEMMGGRIDVNSEQGKGSTFSFTFKMAVAEAAQEEESEAAGEEDVPLEDGELTGKCILIAEDVEVNREILIAYMEDTGAEIDCAENGVEVLSLLEQNPSKYCVIFMDVQMPEMDGLEATRQLRGKGYTLPVVAVTANVFKEDIEKCSECGMDDYLSKPVNMEDFLKMVVKYCKSNPHPQE